MFSIYISRTWCLRLKTILWNHIMKNFEVKHCQGEASYSPKHFLLKALSNYKTFALLTRVYPQIYHRTPCPAVLESIHKFIIESITESIHKFIIEIHLLQCLFGRGSNKKQTRGRIISNFTEGETFPSLMTTKRSWR